MLRAKWSLLLSDPISKYFPRFVPHIADPMVFDFHSGPPPVASRGDFQIFRIAAVLNRIINNVQNRLGDCAAIYRDAV